MNTSAISSVSAGSAHAVEVATSARSRAVPFNPSALRNAAPAEQRKAAAAQFEAILVRQLLGKTMSSMLGGAESGVAGSVYGDMLSDTISQQLTSGPGLGLGRFLEQQLAPKSPVAGAATQSSPSI